MPARTLHGQTPTSRDARGRRSHHARPGRITGRAHGEYMRALSAGGVPAACLRCRRDNPAAR